MMKEIIPEIERCYYENGQVSEKYYLLNKQLKQFHREDGPAVIRYYEDGKIKEETYYINDQWHRKNGPAYIYYYKV